MIKGYGGLVLIYVYEYGILNGLLFFLWVNSDNYMFFFFR